MIRFILRRPLSTITPCSCVVVVVAAAAMLFLLHFMPEGGSACGSGTARVHTSCCPPMSSCIIPSNAAVLYIYIPCPPTHPPSQCLASGDYRADFIMYGDSMQF